MKWHWEQTTGTPVMLSAMDIANPTFIAPNVSAPTVLSFKVMAQNGDVTREAIVNIEVVKAQGTVNGGGTGCNFGGGTSSGIASSLVVGALALLARRRRRA